MSKKIQKQYTNVQQKHKNNEQFSLKHKTPTNYTKHTHKQYINNKTHKK